MKKTSQPARVHIILARESPTAVVIRRGPSKSVCTLLWDRQKDTFKIGQWMRGRIYERRCDLSPDGKHFLYFAMNGKWDGELKGSWTAISRTPYLKAIGLWAKGDCWHGGGLFRTNRDYWLNAGYGMDQRLAVSQLKQDGGFRFSESYGGERVKMKVQVTSIENNFNPTVFNAIDIRPDDDPSAATRGRKLGSGRIIYQGTELPQGFKLNCHATVEGRYDSKRGAFVATHIQTQCPSKYEGQEVPPPPVLPSP